MSKLRRIQLFQARHQKRLAPKGIPLLEQDVRDSDLKPRKHDPANLSATLSTETVGFIKRIRYHQLINRARLAVSPKIDDYVREERIPEAAPQKSLFDILFPMYRPLNPSRVERKSLASTSPENCKLIIQVLRGFNLPTRIIEPRQKESLSHADVDPNVGFIVCFQ